jgi:fermentation-respiration switch protein FrsA (DUF1100 family)
VFEYFENNYPWNLATVTALAMGAVASDLDSVCRPLRAIAETDANAGTEAWAQAWSSLGWRLDRQARRDEAQNHLRSAGRKYLRGALYHLMAERPVRPSDPNKLELYREGIRMFRRGIELGGRPAEFVEIPYGGSSIPAIHVPARAHGPAPCIIQFNGFDWIKEFNYLITGEEWAERGIANLYVDQPGSGGALRLNRMAAEIESEKPAAACVDYLETRRDVDPRRIGICAASLGGYYAPRAAAFEKRLQCCVAQGAFFDAGEVAEMRARRGASYAQSVPHLEEQMMWVLGCDSMAAVAEKLRRITLKGVADKITCPLLIVHGGNDRQIPIDHGQKTYDAAINRRSRKLVVLGPEDGGVEHCSIDNVPLAVELIGDWIADTLGVSPVS